MEEKRICPTKTCISHQSYQEECQIILNCPDYPCIENLDSCDIVIEEDVENCIQWTCTQNAIGHGSMVLAIFLTLLATSVVIGVGICVFRCVRRRRSGNTVNTQDYSNIFNSKICKFIF